jgi:periplasmic divalent cation tolerance protein
MGEVLMGRYSNAWKVESRKWKDGKAVELGKIASWRREAVMKNDKQSRVVLMTCGSLAEGRRIAREVVKARLAACVNVILGPVESVYRWKGKIEKGREYLLVMKTTAGRVAKLEREVKRLHSYEVPEIIALPIIAGSDEYLGWLQEGVKSSR